MATIAQAIAVLEKNLLTVIKRRMLQEGPQILQAYYSDYLQPMTTPDRQAKKSKRLYYSTTNNSDKLRRLYGNITRATIQGEAGNISHVEVVGGKVVFISGIDEDTKVKAGPDMVSLEYARFHEEGTTNYKARPFLGPGFEDFLRDGIPDIMDAIADDLAKIYRSVR